MATIEEFNPVLTHPELFTGRIGKLKNVKLHIEMDPSCKPTQIPAYEIPFSMYDLTYKKLMALEEQGIIKRPTGRVKWISHMNPVEKLDKDGNLVDIRITINSKCFNKAVIPQKRHIPSVVELTHAMNGMEYFSKLDFIEAFSQIELDDDQLHAMSTLWGLFVITRMHMGLNTASELFQEIMEKLLIGITGVKVALDDVIISGKTKDECKQSTLECLDRIKEAGMTLNLKKCQFLQPEVEFSVW